MLDRRPVGAGLRRFLFLVPVHLLVLEDKHGAEILLGNLVCRLPEQEGFHRRIGFTHHDHIVVVGRIDDCVLRILATCDSRVDLVR